MAHSLAEKALLYWHSVEFFTHYDLEKTIEESREDKRPEFHLDQPSIDGVWQQYSQRKWTVYLAVFDIGQACRLVAELVNGPDLNDLIRQRDEEMAPEGRSCFAKLPVAADGTPDFKALSLSTLPWALGQLRRGKMNALCAESFEQAAEDLRHQMASSWSCQEEPSLTPTYLRQLADMLLTWAGAGMPLTSPAWIDVVGKPAPKDVGTTDTHRDNDVQEDVPPSSDELPILNSFYFHDLTLARTSLSGSQAPNPLRSYLQHGGVPKLDLESPAGEAHIRQSLAPENFNAGRWPSEPHQLQSLMQQFSLNKLLALSPGDILSVNGPPGTGKTTLLRDLIADLIVRRASELAKLTQASDGVTGQTVTIVFGNGKQRTIPLLHPTLTGSEIVVCSSNNGAVENLSLELPQQEGLAETFQPSLSYFQPVAAKYAGTRKNLAWEPPVKPVWGLVSAALGKSANRKRFGDIFGYRAVDPKQRPAKQFLAKTKVKLKDWDEVGAMSFWRFRETQSKTVPSFSEARQRFQQAARDYQDCLHAHTQLRHQWLELLRLWGQARQDIASLLPLDADRQSLDLLADLELQIQLLANQQMQKEQLLGPGWLRWLLKWLRRAEYRDWLATRQQALLIQGLRSALRVVQRLQQTCGPVHLCDGKPLDSTRNQEKTFWQGQEYNQRRSELFASAMDLHQAFFLEAAENETLFALGDLLSRPVSSGPALALWQWLFLLTPVVSSTFASVRRQFRGVGPGSFGWLVVDEAGQAVPQAVIGAIVRSQRTVVVGDPLQIEPVVTMPSKLIDKLGEYWLQDQAGHYAAHQHSVQTLADRAHAYGVRHPHLEDQFIGIPLVVHRRCDNPMFDIANRIAYRQRMKHGKDGRIATHPVLGPSAWWDVAGAAMDSKYVKEQGERAFDALVSLYRAEAAAGRDGLPDVYVITPFREVKQGLLKLLLDKKQWQQRLAEHQLPLPDLTGWQNRIGTVHTFQGKEAAIVLFVLGCDETRMGAVAWASCQPNLLNVAVTRAKKHCYIIGNKALWSCQRYFDTAAALLDAAVADHEAAASAKGQRLGSAVPLC
ncbi:DEAD/DEAH box helicase [Chromobacterium piscinae]|uniref:DEAD/DEAH box helicase n=1 Tax=Chromobacterium piscinae TaxID=686831 RepID=UPI001E4931B2|nr:AAA domain-containing protein [Chromobacterium piscinae]MCD5329428.1 ATP-binding protein [Chromobacterium piscinae]